MAKRRDRQPEFWQMIKHLRRNPKFGDQTAAKLVDAQNYRGLLRAYQRAREAGTLPTEPPVPEASRDQVDSFFDYLDLQDKLRIEAKPDRRQAEKELGIPQDVELTSFRMNLKSKILQLKAEIEDSPSGLGAKDRQEALRLLQEKVQEIDRLEDQLHAVVELITRSSPGPYT